MSNNARRPNHWRSPALMAVIDAVLINVAFVLAYAARYTYQIGGTVELTDYITLSGLLPLQITITLVVMAVLIGQGAYRQQRATPIVDQACTDRRRHSPGDDDCSLCLPHIPSPVAVAPLVCLCLGVLCRPAGGGSALLSLWSAPGSDAGASGWSGCSLSGRDRWGERSCRTSWPSPSSAISSSASSTMTRRKQEDIGRAEAFGSTDNVAQVVDAGSASIR